MIMIYEPINPVIFAIGPFIVRWYALAYVVGILLGWFCIKRTNRQTGFLSAELMDAMVNAVIIGVIVGGRIGYVFFYNAEYYLANPWDIIKIWQGGMSFHGGMIGVICSTFYLSYRYKTPFFNIMDSFALVAPIGLFFGRIANFINGELYGRPTDQPWGVVFPGTDGLPRHPSQLYEAGTEGLLLGLLLLLWWRLQGWRYPASTSGMFLFGYGSARFCIEWFREPDSQLGLLALQLSMGQWLCLPMILIGALLITYGAIMRPPIEALK
jgi:phosphatidylglycerol---prolipoprotein diacylglyceryl transferase